MSLDSRTHGNGEVEHNSAAEHLQGQRLASSHGVVGRARGPMARHTPVMGLMAIVKSFAVSGEVVVRVRGW